MLIFCSGGAELLFNKIKRHEVTLPSNQETCMLYSPFSLTIEHPLIGCRSVSCYEHIIVKKDHYKCLVVAYLKIHYLDYSIYLKLKWLACFFEDAYLWEYCSCSFEQTVLRSAKSFFYQTKIFCDHERLFLNNNIRILKAINK